MKVVDELLSIWEERQEQGTPISPEELCAKHPELLDEVRWNIRALQAVDSHFGSTRADQSPLTIQSEPALAPIPLDAVKITTEYRIERLHASGGLGSVFVATDSTLNRQVAIKIPKWNQLSPELLGRFEREARVTGRMDHPGIVPVHALQRENPKHPCYVMRFVEGPTLYATIRALHQGAGAARSRDFYHSLGFRQLLQNLIAVSNIVAYAHGQGIIHRDIKPGNVIIGPFGETILLDWGLAKIIGEKDELMSNGVESGDCADVTATRTGQVLGTPAFAAPEQLLGNTKAIDQRSDVFSLGATLHFLLTGTLLVQQHETAKYLHRISSERLSLIKLSSRIPKPLAAICRTATHISSDLRYRGALEFADDIQRYLAHEPIHVMRDSMATRGFRWMRKHRATTAAGAISLLLLLAFSVLGLSLLSNFNRQLESTNNELATSNSALELSNREAQESRTAAELNFAAAADAVDQFLVAITDNDRLRQTDFSALRKDLLESSKPFLEKLRDQRPGEVSVEKSRVKAISKLASIDQETGRIEEAISGYLLCKTTLQSLIADHPDVAEFRSLLADCHSSLGWISNSQGNTEQTMEHYHTALELRRKLATEFPDDPKHRARVVKSQIALGILLRGQRDFVGAQKHFDESISTSEKLVADFPEIPDYQSSLATGLEHLGLLLARTGKLPSSLEKRRSALAIREKLVQRYPDSVSYRAYLALNQLNVGLALAESTNPAPAQEHYQVALEILEQLVREFPANPIYHEHLAKVHTNLGNLVAGLGDHPRAIEHHEKAIQINLQLSDRYPDNFDHVVSLGGSYSNFGYFLRNSDQETALEWFDKAVSILNKAKSMNPEDYTVRTFLRNTLDARATTYNMLARYTEAAEDWKQAAEYDESRVKPILLNQAEQARERAVLSEKFEQILMELAEVDSPLERIQFAQFCYARKLYARAATEFALGLDQQPQLLDEHAYNAACSAALALAGKGTDAVDLDTSQRGKLSQSALNWLQSDFTRISKGTSSGKTVFQHWLTDPDLEMLRQTERLTELPAQDQESWRALWVDVKKSIEE